MKNRKLLLSFGSICLVLVLAALPFMAACAKPAPKPEPIVLKAVTVAPTNAPLVASIHPFIERVNERAKGELIIELVGGPEAIGGWDQPDAVRSGVVDLFLHYDDTSRFPAGNAVYYTPLTGPEMRETGLYDLVAEMYKTEQRLVYLGIGGGYSRMRVFTDIHVDTPYELAGQKFRGSPAWNEFLVALDISGVMMPDEQIYTAIEQGLIDGYLQQTRTVWHYGLHEVTKYMIVHPFYRMSVKFLLNLDSWNRLPQHLQKLLMDVAIELEPEQRDRDAAEDKESMQKVLDAGMEPIEFSPADAKSFLDIAYNSMWEKILKEHPENGPKLKELAGL